MKVIVSGGRDYKPKLGDFSKMEQALLPLATEIVSGKCRGADRLGEAFAMWYGLKLTPFYADWKLYGRSAGPRRNEIMAKHADVLYVFPGGRGTQDMIMRAVTHGLQVIRHGKVGA